MESLFWTNLTFILCWITGWGYLAFLFFKDSSKFAFWKKGRIRKYWVNLVAVVGLLLVPFVWVNFHQDEVYYDYKRHLDKIEEDGSVPQLMAFHQYAIQEHSNNTRVNIEFLIYAVRNGLKSWLIDRADFYQFQISKGIEVEKFQLLSHLGSVYSGLHAFKYEHGKVEDENLVGLYHFLIAEREFRDGDARNAQDHFLIALEDKELEDLAYERLETIWFYYYSFDELSDYAYDMDLFPHLPFSLKNEVYIKDGSWDWYLFNGIYRDFLSADLPAYLAVGFSMFVWLLFITRVLFIRKDKWKYMIPLFLLGAILPVLVYVLSDLLKFFYDQNGIELDHSSLIYCVVNIGMVEELVKTIPWVIVYFLFKKRFHRPVHFMLLPIVSALGFAFSENLIYVNSNDYELVFVRSGISLIMHLSCSAIIGYMAWRANLKKGLRTKFLYLGGGFLLASVLHGVFDFVIFARGGYLNMIVLFITLHLFILFINNAINFSGIRHKNAVKQLRQSGGVLLVGLIAIFLIQYLIIGWNYSPSSANLMFMGNIIFVLVTTIYLVATFSRIRLRPRVLYKFSFADVFGQFMTTSRGNYMDEVDYKENSFRLFAPKTNVFVGNQFPIRAKALRRVVIQNDLRWWLVEFEQPVYVNQTDRTYGIIKSKESDQDLFMDKVEVILLMIPDYKEFEERKKHHSKDFIYTGRIYSRPLVMSR